MDEYSEDRELLNEVRMIRKILEARLDISEQSLPCDCVVRFDTNLKGLNALTINGKEFYLSDENCECLVRQIVDKLGVDLNKK